MAVDSQSVPSSARASDYTRQETITTPVSWERRQTSSDRHLKSGRIAERDLLDGVAAPTERRYCAVKLRGEQRTEGGRSWLGEVEDTAMRADGETGKGLERRVVADVRGDGLAAMRRGFAMLDLWSPRPRGTQAVAFRASAGRLTGREQLQTPEETGSHILTGMPDTLRRGRWTVMPTQTPWNLDRTTKTDDLGGA